MGPFKAALAASLLLATASGEFTCKDGAYEGAELLSIENVGDLATCKDHCKNIDGCTSLTLKGDECSLFGKTAVLEPAKAGQSCTQVVTLLFECAVGKTFASAVFSIGDIASLEECQQQCSGFPDVCKGVNFGSDSVCEIVDTVDSYAPTTDPKMTSCAVSTTASTSTQDPSTFRCTAAATVDGTDILSFSGSNSVDDCAVYCEQIPGCSGFSLDASECTLKAGEVSLAKTPGAKTVACLRDDDEAKAVVAHGAAYSCSEEPVAYAGGDMVVITHVSLADCQNWCESLPECALVVYSTDKGCVLKRDTAQLVADDKVSQARFPVVGLACTKDSNAAAKPAGFGAVVDAEAFESAGSLDVSSQYTCSDDVAFGGSVIESHASGTSAGACKTLCLKQARCAGVVMKDGACSLVADLTVSDTPVVVDGQRVCSKNPAEDVAGYRCQAARAYTGGHVRMLPGTASISECARACDGTAGCVITVFNPSSKMCHLKALHAAPTSNVLEASVACVSDRVDVRHGYHCSSALSVVGGTLSLISDISLETCKDQCDRMAECATIQYTAATKTCEMKGVAGARTEPGATDAVVCAKPSDPAARKDTASRSAQLLSSSETTTLVGYAKLRFGLHMTGMNQTLFELADSTDIDTESDVTSLWFTAYLRAPVGADPANYGWAAFSTIANEMDSDDNIFMTMLNPALASLGLPTISAGANGRWSLVHSGAEWIEATVDTLSIPLMFKTIPGVDWESDPTRTALAKYIGAALSLPASSISMSAIYACDDEYGVSCTLVWSAAQSDTAGGARSRAQVLSDPVATKVEVVIDVPANVTYDDLCLNITTTLCNETDLNETIFYTRFGLLTCGSCGGDGDGEGEAPVDASVPSGSGFGSRHLLQVEEAVTAAFQRFLAVASSTHRVTNRNRNAKTLAVDTTGTRPGLERTCTPGWQSEDYGVMSSLFDVTEDSVTNPVTGTLAECVSACAAANCSAFTRDASLADDDSGDCQLKKTTLPVAGDVFATGDYRTYVVGCPAEPEACKWSYLDGRDIKAQSTVLATSYTGTAMECKALCALSSDCLAVVFDKDSGDCSFISDLQQALTETVEDEAYLTAVCYRASATSPCDSGFCGVGHDTACLPLSAETYGCACAEGFACTANCGASEPHTCERDMSLAELFKNALALALNLDAEAMYFDSYQELSGEDPNAIPNPPVEDIITLSGLKADVPTTHVYSIVFSKTTFTDLLATGTTSSSLSKAHTLVDTITTDLNPSGEVAIESVCQVYSDGELGTCVDSSNNEISKTTRPVVKVSVPSRNHQAAVDWCLSADPIALAEPTTAEEIADLVYNAQGEMVETRKYWVGATCDENCDTASEWTWTVGQSAVDWDTLGLSAPSADTGCAVLAYDATEIRWGLVAVACDASSYYPVCEYTSTASQDHAEECDSDTGCDLKLTLKIKIDHVRDVYFVTLPDGTTQQYHPTLDLPAGVKIQNRDGTTLGYVDSNGKTSVIKYPPVDQPVNSALMDLMPSVTYVSEALAQYMSRNMQSWLTTAELDTYNSACHDAVISKHVKCVDLMCTTVEPMIVRRTSCLGAPPCLDSGCNGNGYAKGFVGYCTCVCETGFGGATCGQCDSGYTNYPTCEEAEGQDTEQLYEVVLLYAQSSVDNVASNHDALREDISTAIGFMADSYNVRYICPTTVCADSYGGCYSPVNTWTSDRRSQCKKYGVDYGTSSARRQSVVLSNDRGYFPLLEDDESVIEVLVMFNSEYSRKPEEASATLLSTFENYLNQGSPGTFGDFYLTNVKSVYGPSTEVDPQLTPAATPESDDTDSSTTEARSASVDIAENASSGVNILLLIVIIIGGLFCCLLLLFACWRRRRNQQKKKRKTQELMKKYSDDEDGDDVVVMYKDVNEPMGIMWDDHTLLVGVCEDSPARRYHLDRFRNRRIAKVNGKEVKTLSDIRYAVDGQSVVTLEFEPRFSSIVVRVHSTLDEFNEHEFLQTFADRVSRALNLMEFTEMDMDLQSVIERSDRGELLLTIKLIGLTSDQVATVVAMCVTPGDPIRAGLPINGAYLATGKGFHLSPPLWVCCQWLSEAAHAAGCFLQLPGVQEEAFPIWQHIPADHWMYSSGGYWVVVNDKSLVGQDVGEGYILKSAEPHRGALPHVITEWRTPVREDKNIIVAEDEPRAGEFIVGQKVVFPDDVELGDGAYINKKSEGIVMAQEEDGLIKVCLLNEEFDVVTVSADVIDSPDGPRVTYLHEGRWMPCTIVKVRQEDGKTNIKLHFDCGLCQDTWIDKEADKDKLKFPPQEVFAIGDQVQLAADVGDDIEDDGCLARQEIGVIVACGDLGQAKPFLVEGPKELSWYSGSHLSHIVPQQLGRSQLNTDAGNMSRMTNDPFANDPYGTQYDE